MQRPSAVLSARSESPVSIESRALGTLAYIRTSIESSSSMDVPGMAGIVMGLIGVCAAILVSLRRWAPHWLGIWLWAAVIALLLGGAMVARQVSQRGRSGYWGPARKFLLCLCPALLAGAVLTAVIWSAGLPNAIPGMWLLLYGCAVLSASTVTSPGIARFICIMGALFVLLGAATFALPAKAHTLMLGMGFGGLHIIFGMLLGHVSNDD
ncbi:MAG: hypothetical protein M3N50_09855 [Pseudomonadota bacterium]|nr:hypothetical protein [Pseudomonadota bacterium]